MTNLLTGWKPIDSAPQTGRTLLLGYWNPHGNWRTVRGQWMSEEYIGQEWEEPDDVEAGWFETAVEADDEPNCWRIEPTHWMPLPSEPCPTCNDQGAVGNILTAQPCPDCTPAPSAPGDAQDKRQAFEAWSIRANQGYDLTPNVSGRMATYESNTTEHAYRGFFHGMNAPAAGDALDAARYRWLREKAHQTAGRAPAAVLCDESDMFQRGESGSESGFIHGKDLDDAIDAALAAQVPQQGEA